MSVLTAEAIFNPFVELETVDLYSRDLDTAQVREQPSIRGGPDTHWANASGLGHEQTRFRSP